MKVAGGDLAVSAPVYSNYLKFISYLDPPKYLATSLKQDALLLLRHSEVRPGEPPFRPLPPSLWSREARPGHFSACEGEQGHSGEGQHHALKDVQVALGRCAEDAEGRRLPEGKNSGIPFW